MDQELKIRTVILNCNPRSIADKYGGSTSWEDDVEMAKCYLAFLKKNLEDTSFFCGATDTPVLDF